MESTIHTIKAGQLVTSEAGVFHIQPIQSHYNMSVKAPIL